MSLVQTMMQSLRAQYPTSFDKNELRQSRYGAWDFFKQDNNSPVGIFNSDIRNKIRQSFGNTVVIPVLDAEEVTIGNVRSCTIADSENTSALVSLTLATYAFGFTMTPSQHFNNDVNYQADFDRKMMKYILKLAATLDSFSVATLESSKNALEGVLSNYYSWSGGALQVAQDEKDDFFNQLEAILSEMDFYGNRKIIGSPSLMPTVRRLSNQGQGNDVNDAFQFGNQEFFYTNRLANASGIQSTLYAVEEGSVAFETRLDPDCIAGHTIGGASDPVKQWGRTMLPLLGIEAGTFYTKDCSDRSNLNASTSGLNRTLLEGYEFSFDIVFATAYNSDSANRYNPIVKAQISAT